MAGMKKLLIFLTFIILAVITVQVLSAKGLLDLQVMLGSLDGLGYTLLWITLPVSMIQGLVTVFPFIAIVALHMVNFGLVEGLLFSWLGGFSGAMLSFVLGRYLSVDLSTRIWKNKRDKYLKMERYVDRYGIWGIIVLRTIPIMPSNIISLLAALSPIRIVPYIWSSIVGNISMVFLLSLLSSTLALTDAERKGLLMGYLIFVVLMAVSFVIHRMVAARVKSKGH